jgi:hypothetical protein
LRVRADEIEFLTGQRRPGGESADHSDKISCLGARQLLDHALAGPLPLLQEDQEIGDLLPVRPLVEPVIRQLHERLHDLPRLEWYSRFRQADRRAGSPVIVAALLLDVVFLAAALGQAAKWGFRPS